MDPERASTGELAEELGTVLARLYSFLRRTILPREMSLTQALVLRTLRDRGPQRVSELAELEGVRQPTCSGLVNTLEEEGWVTRRVDESDRRAVVVELTPQGRAVLQAIGDARASVLEQHLATLSASERRALADALPGLRKLIAQGTEAVSA